MFPLPDSWDFDVNRGGAADSEVVVQIARSHEVAKAAKQRKPSTARMLRILRLFAGHLPAPAFKMYHCRSFCSHRPADGQVRPDAAGASGREVPG